MGSPNAIRPKDDFHWPNLGVKAPIDADERPVHQVCLGKFSIGQTEVTAAAWERTVGKAPAFGVGNDPAAGMSWDDVQGFIEVLNTKAGRTRYRLPTEAEWEYACRAGQKKEPDRTDNFVIKGAWYAHSWVYRSRAQTVGSLAPNEWGLFDMLGNVWEWTADVYRKDAYRRHTLYQPREDHGRGDSGSERVIRGASFRSEYLQVRCAARGHFGGSESLPQIGFRLVRTS
jgi:formylglycine-generating enzyme required for sulfatase activity